MPSVACGQTPGLAAGLRRPAPVAELELELAFAAHWSPGMGTVAEVSHGLRLLVHGTFDPLVQIDLPVKYMYQVFNKWLGRFFQFDNLWYMYHVNRINQRIM